MHTRWIEVSVGVFMVAGFLALAFLGLQVSGLTFDSEEDTYTLYAQFDDLGGLTERSKVSVAGVTIGRVTDISLLPKTHKALVEMQIYASVDNLTEDSIASIQTSGLLGEKYIDIGVGGAPDLLADGDEIFETQSAIVLESLISNFAGDRISE